MMNANTQKQKDSNAFGKILKKPLGRTEAIGSIKFPLPKSMYEMNKEARERSHHTKNKLGCSTL